MRTAAWIVVSAVVVVLAIIFLTWSLVHAKRATPATLGGGELEKQPWALEHSQLLTFLGIAVTTAAALFAIFVAPRFAPHSLHGKERADVQNNIRDTGLKVTAGLAAAFAAVLTWGRLELSRLEHRNQVSGQITERYTRAVDQMGNPDPAVRLGGLYALERIALDSIGDRSTVCRVISSYVRYRASAELPPPSASDAEGPSAEGERTNGPTEAGRAYLVTRDASITNEPPKDMSAPPQAHRVIAVFGPQFAAPEVQGTLAVDVGTALSILARREPFWRAAIDLSGAKLSGAYLFGAYLARADLRGTYLARADLAAAYLSAANLTRANLSRAHLRWSNLSDINLSGADLSGADLRGANLMGAILRGANLMGADLSRAAADALIPATAAILSPAPLTRAEIDALVEAPSQVILSGIPLTPADIKRIKNEAYVRAPNEAILARADLSGADLSGADLSGAIGLVQDQIDSATTDPTTKLPPGLHR